MATNNLTLPISPGQLRLITTAETTARQAFEYVDGKRTDTPRVNDAGWQVHTARDLSGSFQGAAVEVTIETSTAQTFPAGAVVEPDGPATLRVRGTSTVGSSFASLALTVSASKWKITGSIADALGLVTEKVDDQHKKAA